MNARHEAVYQALREWRVADVLSEVDELSDGDPDFAAFVYYRYLREDDAEIKEVLLGLWRAVTRRARPKAAAAQLRAVAARIRDGEEAFGEALELMETTSDAYAFFVAAFASERNREAKKRMAQHLVRYRAYGPAVNFLLKA
jgi:hypothetical protein